MMLAHTMLLLLTLFLFISGDDTLDRSLDQVIASERAFSQRCGEVGIRASFLEFFDDSCIAFKPEPFVYASFVKTLPPQSNPKAISLRWESQFAGIAASGDLGFSSGPSIRKNTTDTSAPVVFGQFFSLWKKQQNGSWKVVVDIGIQTPTEFSPMGAPVLRVLPLRSDRPASKQSGDASRKGLLEVETALSSRCEQESSMQWYVASLDSVVRRYCENSLPVVGVEAVQRALSISKTITLWNPERWEESEAGDLGYVYGRYRVRGIADHSPVIESGYYLHVWRRNASGEWKLIADIANPREEPQ
jgi:ketosteroid isomerase-like protein